MEQKLWKKLKRTGNIKRKILKEYLRIKSSSCSSVSRHQKICDNSINEIEPTSSQHEWLSCNEEGSVHQINQTELQFIHEEYASDDSCTVNEEKQCTEHMKNLMFREEIRKWAVEKNITQAAVKDLAVILNKRFPDILPNDPRTILNTPRQVHIKSIGQGEYWHNGVIETLKNVVSNTNVVPEKISLNINMDGLPIFNSSKKEFWPILCNIQEINEPPFVIGIYYGIGKPKDLNIYLEDFISEMSIKEYKK